MGHPVHLHSLEGRSVTFCSRSRSLRSGSCIPVRYQDLHILPSYQDEIKEVKIELRLWVIEIANGEVID